MEAHNEESIDSIDSINEEFVKIFKKILKKILIVNGSFLLFFVFIFWFHIKLGAAPGAALALLAATLLQLQKKAFGLRK